MTLKIPKEIMIQRNVAVIMCCAFFVTKMLRSFSGSTVAGGIWNYIQILFVLMGGLIIVKNIVKFLSNKIFLALFLYTVLAMLNGLFFIEFSKNRLFSYFMIAYPVCLLALMCKDACFRDIEKNIMIKLTFYIIAGIFIIAMLNGGKYSTSTGAVADVYYVLGLLPLMMIYTKKYKVIPCLICGVAVLLSGKRAGIALVVVMIVLYYFFDSTTTKEWQRVLFAIIKISVVLVVFVLLFKLVNDKFNSNLLHRVQIMLFERDSSGRDVLRSRIISALKSSNIVYWIFGHGDGGAAATIGSNVHNDFLEVLYNFGVFPCVAYAWFYLNCALELLRMLHSKYEYVASFAMSIVCSLVLAMFSFYVIDPTYITCGMISIGYLIIDFRKKHYTNSIMLRVF